MSYLFLLAMLVLTYVRPGDMFPEARDFPFLPVASALTGVTLILSWIARTSRPAWVPHLSWLVGAWLAFVFSHVAQTYRQAAIDTFTGFFPQVFFTAVTFFILTNRNRIRGFTTVWILATVFLAVYGMVLYVTGEGWGGQTLYRGRIRGVGIFGDPNDLALAFIIAVPLCHARFFKTGLPGKILFYGLTIIFTYMIFLTNSRGGVISLLIVFFALSAHRFGRKLGIVVGTILVLALFAMGPSRVDEIDTKEASAQGRIAAWSEGLQMFKKHPLAGVGYGLFLDHHRRTAHNSFVLCLAETGLIGAFFWVGLLYVTFLALRLATKAAKRAPPDDWIRGWANDTQIALLGFLCAAVFLSRTYNLLLYVLIGFAAAVYHLALTERPEAKLTVRPKDRLYIFGIVCAGVVITYILVQTFAIWTSRFY